MQLEMSEMETYKEDYAQSSASSSKPHPGSIRRMPVTAAAVKPLQSFWVEQGLKAHTAHSIAQDMIEAQSPYCDVSLLATQVQRLGRVIPGNVQVCAACASTLHACGTCMLSRRLRSGAVAQLCLMYPTHGTVRVSGWLWLRPQDMVARDWRILDATPHTVAQHYVQLVELFPGQLDVSELARKQPKLL